MYYLDKLLPQTQLEHQPFTNNENEKYYLEGLGNEKFPSLKNL